MVLYGPGPESVGCRRPCPGRPQERPSTSCPLALKALPPERSCSTAGTPDRVPPPAAKAGDEKWKPPIIGNLSKQLMGFKFRVGRGAFGPSYLQLDLCLSRLFILVSPSCCRASCAHSSQTHGTQLLTTTAALQQGDQSTTSCSCLDV